MKAILISFILIFTNFVLAQCPTGSVTLRSQDQIDQFAVNYPNCEVINGSLYIVKSNAADLTPLSRLRTINGHLTIVDNPNLLTLNGLGNILNIFEKLTIAQNDSLVDLRGLEGLELVMSNLSISFNQNLKTLNGIESLTQARWITIQSNPNLNNIQALNNIFRINSLSIINNDVIKELPKLYNLSNDIRKEFGNIIIMDNKNLLNLNGLDSLKSFVRIDIINNNRLKSLYGLQNMVMDTSEGVGLYIARNDSLLTLTGLESVDSIKASIDGHLWIIKNGQLQNLNGLNNLKYIERDLEISGNPSLTDLKALKNLNYVGRDIFIYSNDTLSTLDGFDSIQFSEDNHVEIISNPLLSFCSTRSICNGIKYGIDMIIQNNLNGCNDIEEIEVLCMSSATEYEENNTVLVHPNPVSNRITIFFKGEVMVRIFDAIGKCLTILNMKDHAEIDLSTYTNGIYYVQTISGKESYITKIIKD